jgi:hypothetical protein
MLKVVSRTLYLLGIVLGIISAIVLYFSAGESHVVTNGSTITLTGVAHPTLAAIASLLFFVGALLCFVAWIGALIRTAQLGRWVWFVCLLLFSGIAMLIYIFWGPKTYAHPHMPLPAHPTSY